MQIKIRTEFHNSSTFDDKERNVNMTISVDFSEQETIDICHYSVDKIEMDVMEALRKGLKRII